MWNRRRITASWTHLGRKFYPRVEAAEKWALYFSLSVSLTSSISLSSANGVVRTVLVLVSGFSHGSDTRGDAGRDMDFRDLGFWRDAAALPSVA